jgi:hypothetical protein
MHESNIARVAVPSNDLVVDNYEAELESRILSSVKTTVLERIGSLVSKAVGTEVAAQIAPLASEVASNKTELVALREQNGQIAEQLMAVQASVSALSQALNERPPAATSAAAEAASTLSWAARPGVVFVGGFDRETSNKIIVACINELVKDWPGRDQVLAVWSPGKRWSSGRLQLPSEIAVSKFLDWLTTHPQARSVVTPSGKKLDLWASREKAPAKRAKDAVTARVARVIGARLQSQASYDPALYEVCYLSRCIYYGPEKLCSCDSFDRWHVHVWESIGGNNALRLEIQKEVDLAISMIPPHQLQS